MDENDCHHEVSTTHGSVESDRLQNVKLTFADWKEFLLVAQKVILWKETYYSGCIAAAVTILFLLWWWMEVSVLSTLAIILFIVVTADYIIPSWGSKLRGGMAWEGLHEEQYEHVCEQILFVYDSTLACWQYIQTKKTTHPKSYMVSVSVFLFIFALIGYAVNNTFLLYLFLLGASLLPGAYHKGLIHRYHRLACQQFKRLTSKMQKRKDD